MLLYTSLALIASGALWEFWEYWLEKSAIRRFLRTVFGEAIIEGRVWQLRAEFGEDPDSYGQYVRFYWRDGNGNYIAKPPTKRTGEPDRMEFRREGGSTEGLIWTIQTYSRRRRWTSTKAAMAWLESHCRALEKAVLHVDTKITTTSYYPRPGDINWGCAAFLIGVALLPFALGSR